MLWWLSKWWQKIYNPTKKLTKQDTHRTILNSLHLCKRWWSYPLISTGINQDPLRCVTEMQLGIIPMKIVTRSYVLKSYYKKNKHRSFKYNSDHNYDAHYFSSTVMMSNASCQPYFSTKQMSNPKIFNTTYHWTG